MFQEKEFLEIGVGSLADGRRHVGIESRGPKGVFQRTGKQEVINCVSGRVAQITEGMVNGWLAAV